MLGMCPKELAGQPDVGRGGWRAELSAAVGYYRRARRRRAPPSIKRSNRAYRFFACFAFALAETVLP
jgi:hypothetical protein